jgi:hypothetical protein
VSDDAETTASYAETIAQDSYTWYRSHAIRARTRYRRTEVLVLFASVSTPASIAVWPDGRALTAVLGASVALLTGLGSTFQWRDDYLSYSQAREAVAAEQRLHHLRVEKYADPTTRDAVLVQEVTRIEQSEMGTWIRRITPTAS